MEKFTCASDQDDDRPRRLLDIVLSLPLKDVLNENLYKHKVSFHPFSTLILKSVHMIVAFFENSVSCPRAD
jgi:hypothetical protein